MSKRPWRLSLGTIERLAETFELSRANVDGLHRVLFDLPDSGDSPGRISVFVSNVEVFPAGYGIEAHRREISFGVTLDTGSVGPRLRMSFPVSRDFFEGVPAFNMASMLSRIMSGVSLEIDNSTDEERNQILKANSGVSQMNTNERPWRLTRASVQKIAQAFNLSQRSLDDLRVQQMTIPGSTRDPKTLAVRINTIERCPPERSADSISEFCVRVVLELPQGFFLAVAVHLPLEFAPISPTGQPTSILNLFNSMALDVDNLTDDERNAEDAKKMAYASQKLSRKNVVNIDVVDSGRAHQLLQQLTALGLAQGHERTVCYIPRSIAVRADTAYLRSLGNVEVYATDERLGDSYRGAPLDHAIILEHFVEGEVTRIVEVIDHLVRTLSMACASSDGNVYRITLREGFSNA